MADQEDSGALLDNLVSISALSAIVCFSLKVDYDFYVFEWALSLFSLKSSSLLS